METIIVISLGSIVALINGDISIEAAVGAKCWAEVAAVAEYLSVVQVAEVRGSLYEDGKTHVRIFAGENNMVDWEYLKLTL